MLPEKLFGGAQDAGGQAQRKKICNPEAPIHRVNRQIGDAGRPIGDKDHPDTDIAGFIHAKIDQFERRLKFAWPISERAGSGALDESIANAVIAQHARRRVVFVIDKLFMDYQITLFVFAKNHSRSALAQGMKSKIEIKDTHLENEPIVLFPQLALIDNGGPVIAGEGIYLAAARRLVEELGKPKAHGLVLRCTAPAPHRQSPPPKPLRSVHKPLPPPTPPDSH